MKRKKRDLTFYVLAFLPLIIMILYFCVSMFINMSDRTNEAFTKISNLVYLCIFIISTFLLFCLYSKKDTDLTKFVIFNIFVTFIMFSLTFQYFVAKTRSGGRSICSNGPNYTEGKKGEINYISCGDVVDGKYTCDYAEEEIDLILPNKISTKQFTCSVK